MSYPSPSLTLNWEISTVNNSILFLQGVGKHTQGFPFRIQSPIKPDTGTVCPRLYKTLGFNIHQTGPLPDGSEPDPSSEVGDE